MLSPVRVRAATPWAETRPRHPTRRALRVWALEAVHLKAGAEGLGWAQLGQGPASCWRSVFPDVLVHVSPAS